MRFLGAPLALAAWLGATACGCGARSTQSTHHELVLGAAHAARAAQPIQGGAIDTGDPAVVGIVVAAGGGLAICTGALIAPNLVLTAHHCVAQIASSSTACATGFFGAPYAANAFRVTSSYDAGASAYASGILPPVDSAVWFGAAKVTVAGADLCGQDLAVLELSEPITGVCPLIPRVDSAVSDGEGYAAVGFGITSPSAAAAGTRYKVGGLSVLCASSCGGATSSTLEWIGGSSAAKGACEGDSGGPALDAAGRILGTVSRGPTSTCNQTVYEGTFGAAAWLRQMAREAASDGGYVVAGWAVGGATSEADNGYCGAGTGGVDAGADSSGADSSGADASDSSGDVGRVADVGAAELGEVDSGAAARSARAGGGGCAMGEGGAVGASDTVLALSCFAFAMAALPRRRRRRAEERRDAAGTDSR